VALAAVAVFTTEASAMYHAGMGVFMQRDPGAGAGGPARMGAGGAPAATGRFIPRDPTGSNQYADGMNLYQYVQGNPVNHLDPSGLRTKDWVWCGSKSIYIETDYCCPDDVKKIHKAACSAFNTLNAVNDALYNHEYKRPWTAAHDYTHTQSNRFFYRRQTGTPPNKDVERVRSVYVDLIDEMDYSDGTFYKCEGKSGACATANAWARPYGGWTVHICHNFLHRSSDKGRSNTLIHELSHLYQQTIDHGSIYINGLDAAGLPIYEQFDKKTKTWTPATLAQDKRFSHADTLSEFALLWYVP
jgi:hypothetical protein